VGSFITIMVAVWAVAMGAWFLVSKYFKSSDADKIKQRLTGIGKARAKKTKENKSGEQSIIHTQQGGNKFAQLVVEKYQLGPKMQLFLEQAGLRWTPARLVHSSIMAFAAGFVFGWVVLPIPMALDLLVGLAFAPAPFLYVFRLRKSRLRKFEAIFPETLEFISRSMRAGHAFSVSLEMIYREFAEPVSGEFRRTFEEHNLGLPIEVALQGLAKRVPSLDVHFFVSAVLLQKRTGGNLAERTGVDDLKKLVAVLIQADRFGTGVAQSLRAHADFMRVQARQVAEEKAAKLGVKLIFPIFFCILPSLFVVTIGPVAMKIVRELIPMMTNM
jgi:tight adherence protein B